MTRQKALLHVKVEWSGCNTGLQRAEEKMAGTWENLRTVRKRTNLT